MSIYTLEIDTDRTTIKVVSNMRGVHSCKQISYDNFQDALMKSVKRDVVSSGVLPLGCLSFSVSQDGKYNVSLLHTEQFADIDYMGSVYPNLPLPRLMFKFEHFIGKRIQKVSMGVVGEGMLTPETPMYHYPFSNVSGYSLCVGNNVLPICKCLNTLGSVPYYILSLPNNNDHFKPFNNKLNMEMRDLLVHLQDKTPTYYYSDILIPNKQTLKDFIK